MLLLLETGSWKPLFKSQRQAEIMWMGIRLQQEVPDSDFIVWSVLKKKPILHPGKPMGMHKS